MASRHWKTIAGRLRLCVGLVVCVLLLSDDSSFLNAVRLWAQVAEDPDASLTPSATRFSRFGYCHTPPLEMAVVDQLVAAAAYEVASDYLRVQVELTGREARDRLRAAIRLLQISPLDALAELRIADLRQEKNLDRIDTQLAASRADLSKSLPGQPATSESSVSDAELPAPRDIELCLRYGEILGTLETIRYLTAAVTALPADKTLQDILLHRRVTTDSAIETLAEDLERRRGELAAMTPSPTVHAWRSELDRLRQLTLIRSLDLQLARLQANANSVDESIAAATAVRQRIAEVQPALVQSSETAVELELANLTAARFLGQSDAAVSRIDEIADRFSGPLRDRLGRLMVETAIQSDTADHAERAAVEIERLLRDPSFDPSDALLAASLWLEIESRLRSGNSPAGQPEQLRSTINRIQSVTSAASPLVLLQRVGESGDFWRWKADAVLLRSGISTDRFDEGVEGGIGASTAIVSPQVQAAVRQSLAAGDWPAAIERLQSAEQIAASENRLALAIAYAQIRFALLNKLLADRTAQEGDGGVSRQAARAAILQLAQQISDSASQYAAAGDAAATLNRLAVQTLTRYAMLSVGDEPQAWQLAREYFTRFPTAPDNWAYYESLEAIALNGQGLEPIQHLLSSWRGALSDSAELQSSVTRRLVAWTIVEQLAAWQPTDVGSPDVIGNSDNGEDIVLATKRLTRAKLAQLYASAPRDESQENSAPAVSKLVGSILDGVSGPDNAASQPLSERLAAMMFESMAAVEKDWQLATTAADHRIAAEELTALSARLEFVASAGSSKQLALWLNVHRSVADLLAGRVSVAIEALKKTAAQTRDPLSLRWLGRALVLEPSQSAAGTSLLRSLALRFPPGSLARNVGLHEYLRCVRWADGEAAAAQAAATLEAVYGLR